MPCPHINWHFLICVNERTRDTNKKMKLFLGITRWDFLRRESSQAELGKQVFVTPHRVTSMLLVMKG